VWILRQLREQVRVEVPVFVDWQAFGAAPHGLFVWEAFVSGAAKAATHAGDAELAVRRFEAALPTIDEANAIRSEEVHSLMGAALLRTGWSADVALLSRPCVVIKA
jgi:hypothetical protein